MAQKTVPENLHSVAMAVAKVRANQAGTSIENWLDSLILAEGADFSSSTRAFPDGGFLRGAAPLAELVAGAKGEDSNSLGGVDLNPASIAGIPDTLARVAAVRRLPGSAVQRISDFSARIDQAAMLLSAAFMEASVTDFPGIRSPRSSRQSAAPANWYTHVVGTCMERAGEVRNALLHHWTPTPHAERLAVDAFVLLSNLSPAADELVQLCMRDRPRAFSELAKQLDAITLQYELSAGLLAEVEAKDSSSDERQFAELRGTLLESAEGGLSLTEAAGLLDVSRQAVHKRIKNGSVLGIMDGPTLVLPRAQFVDRNGKYEVVSGLPELLKLFGSAGEWSALQFLVEPDPNLAAKTPLNVLADGRVEDVLSAARAYLDIGES